MNARTDAAPDLDIRLERLATAWDWTADRLRVVDPDALDRATPCRDLDLGALLDHLAESVERFVIALGGTVPATDGAGTVERLGSLRVAHLAAWDAADPDRAVELPLGVVPSWLAADVNLAEVVLHGWDIGRATGERADAPDALAEPVLAIGTQLLTDETRGAAFAPAVDIADAAGASDRMAAWYGRRP